MKPYKKLRLLAGVCAITILSGISTANAQDTKNLSPTANQPNESPFIITETDDTYIVRLADPAVAVYNGGIAGYEATSAKANGDKKLDTNSPAAIKYANRLKRMQSELIDKASNIVGRQLETEYDYQHAVNGFALELTLEEAKALGAMQGVVSVQRERMEHLTTDVGPALINAPRIWNKRRGGTRGEGQVVAVFDSGINHDHPSFAATGGDGYTHTNPLGSGNFVPGSYCDTVDPTFCNDKLIGAWDMAGEDGTIPEDDDGHGSHTASTAAGNVIFGAEVVAPTTTQAFDITGVAPHANIIAYDVCVGRGCPGAALVAAVNQVVIDAGNLPNGIASLNFSISGGGDPYNDTVELGFLAAVEAGIYVAASAGNSGPTASTVAHLGPWVSTTAASTHSRQISNTLADITSDSASLGALSGLGFTSSYGPATIVNSADFEAEFPGATVCGVGEIGDNISPWPADFFNGEIVACTRGTFGRVEKGINVLAAGAGGYVLIDNGAGVTGDAHVLPGVHISAEDGATLAAFLAANADANPQATITGAAVDIDDALSDKMAGFSSRGPQLAFDVLKPDLTAPGVDIVAAEATTDGSIPAPEYQFLSGTSMSSPHNAGAGALLAARHPEWTPQNIKSALMLTASNRNTFKEDGVTPTDPFDLGAGRIDLAKADRAGLVMDETIENFVAANPALGGDPSSLNIASLMNSNCVGVCTWTRTVTNKTNRTRRWTVSSDSDDFDVEIDVSVEGRRNNRYRHYRNNSFTLRPGKSAEITVTISNYTSDDGWLFGSIELDPNGRRGYGYYNFFDNDDDDYRYYDYFNYHYFFQSRRSPKLSMPIAVQTSRSTDASTFTKTASASEARRGDIITYELAVNNGLLAGPITVTDKLPRGTRFVAGSELETVTQGATTSALSYDNASRTVSWTGELELNDIVINADPGGSPGGGYLPLSTLGVAPQPLTCNGDCDDGGFFFSNLPSFTFNGTSYTEVLFSVNGTVELGSESGAFSSFANQNLPDENTPNNILAPFWRDLNLNDGGNMYVGTLSGGDSSWVVFEWEAVPHFSDTGVGAPTVSMQIWAGVDGTPVEGQIHYVYGVMDDTTVGGTVGAENAQGTVGTSYFFNGAGTAPLAGDELLLSTVEGGSATLSFDVKVKRCRDLIINEANLSNGENGEMAIAVTRCERKRYRHGYDQ